MRIIKTIMDLDKELKIGRMFVEPEEMELIEKAFNLNNLTDEEEIRNIRDIVVVYYSAQTSMILVNTNNNPQGEDYKRWLQLENNMSGITATIDNRLYNLGREV